MKTFTVTIRGVEIYNIEGVADPTPNSPKYDLGVSKVLEKIAKSYVFHPLYTIGDRPNQFVIRANHATVEITEEGTTKQ